jgi:hypothetical protein
VGNFNSGKITDNSRVFTNLKTMTKKMITLLILLITFTFRLSAPEFRVLNIQAGVRINPYEKIWLAVCKVESDFDPLAYHMEDNDCPSIGIVQIQQSRVDDYFRRTGKRFKLSDCYDPAISKEIWIHYATLHHYSQIEEICRKWNGGEENGMKYKQTIVYWNKVKSNLK